MEDLKMLTTEYSARHSDCQELRLQQLDYGQRKFFSAQSENLLDNVTAALRQLKCILDSISLEPALVSSERVTKSDLEALAACLSQWPAYALSAFVKSTSSPESSETTPWAVGQLFSPGAQVTINESSPLGYGATIQETLTSGHKTEPLEHCYDEALQVSIREALEDSSQLEKQAGAVHQLDKKRCRLPRVTPAHNLGDKVWEWRKYGEKPLKSTPYHRSYYRCSSRYETKCPARRLVDHLPKDRHIYRMEEVGGHNHEPPVKAERRFILSSIEAKRPPHVKLSGPAPNPGDGAARIPATLQHKEVYGTSQKMTPGAKKPAQIGSQNMCKKGSLSELNQQVQGKASCKVDIGESDQPCGSGGSESNHAMAPERSERLSAPCLPRSKVVPVNAFPAISEAATGQTKVEQVAAPWPKGSIALDLFQREGKFPLGDACKAAGSSRRGARSGTVKDPSMGAGLTL